MGVVGVVRLLRTDIVVQGGAASFITVSSAALGRTSLVTRTSIPTVCKNRKMLFVNSLVNSSK